MLPGASGSEHRENASPTEILEPLTPRSDGCNEQCNDRRYLAQGLAKFQLQRSDDAFGRMSGSMRLVRTVCFFRVPTNDAFVGAETREHRDPFTGANVCSTFMTAPWLTDLDARRHRGDA